MNKLSVVAIAVIIIGIGAYLLLSRPQQNKPVDTATSASQIPTILNGLITNLGITTELRDYNYMDWLDDKGSPLPLKGKQFIVSTSTIRGVTGYPTFSEDSLTSITTKNLAPLLTKSDSYLTNLGFTKNAENTRNVGAESITTAFYGYEKDSLKCIIRIDELTDPFGNFVCGVIDSEQLTMQEPFKPVFMGTKRDGDEINSIRVQKIEGDYAMGSANGVFSGYTWMAKKTKGAWEVVWRGTEIPLCSEMEKYGIPESIYENCYNLPA